MTDLVQRLKARIALLREINETQFAGELEQANARIEALEDELLIERGLVKIKNDDIGRLNKGGVRID